MTPQDIAAVEALTSPSPGRRIKGLQTSRALIEKLDPAVAPRCL